MQAQTVGCLTVRRAGARPELHFALRAVAGKSITVGWGVSLAVRIYADLSLNYSSRDSRCSISAPADERVRPMERVPPIAGPSSARPLRATAAAPLWPHPRTPADWLSRMGGIGGYMCCVY
jgi:hypothetical protein